MKDSLIIEGRQYISVSRASEITKYSGDYVGQLCRTGKIIARMVGRNWFIDERSIIEYKKTVETAHRYVSQRAESKKLVQSYQDSELEPISEPGTVSSPVAPQPDVIQPLDWKFTYTSDERALLPTLRSGKEEKSLPPSDVGEVIRNIRARTKKAFESGPGLSRSAVLAFSLLCVLGLSLAGATSFSAGKYSLRSLLPDALTDSAQHILSALQGSGVFHLVDVIRDADRLLAGISPYSPETRAAAVDSLTAGAFSAAASTIGGWFDTSRRAVTTIVNDIFARPVPAGPPSVPAPAIPLVRTPAPAHATTTIVVERYVDSSRTTLVPFADPSILSRLSVLESHIAGLETLRTPQADILARNFGLALNSVSSVSSGGSSSASTGTFSSDVTVGGSLTVSGSSVFSGNAAFDSNTLFIDAANNRVGIGTSSPTDTFSVNGPIYLANTSPSATVSRLYANGGDLYWSGNLVGGASSGVWSTDGTHVWRPTGNVGIGTTSPNWKLSVAGVGSFDDFLRASYFTATSTTASTFPYASTTALTVSGINGLSLGSLNGPLQANNGTVSATTSVGVLYGGTGLAAAPSYGQILLGNSSGGYTLTSTSSLSAGGALITVVHSDGTQTYYNATTSSDLGNGVALSTAVSASRSGDSFYLAAATFDLATRVINMSVSGGGSFSLHGAGKYNTIIKSGSVFSSYGVSNGGRGPAIRPASNSETTDLTIQLTDTTRYGIAWGEQATTGQDISSTTMRNVRVIGFTDGIFLNSSSGTAKYSVSLYNVDVETVWDTIVFSQPSGVLNIYNSAISSITNAALDPNNGGTIAEGPIATNGTINIYNSTISASGGSSQNNGVLVNGASGVLNFYSGAITTIGTGGTDLRRSNGTLNVTSNVIYDPTKTSGTITRVDNSQLRYSLASNGASSTILWNNNGVANWVATSSLGLVSSQWTTSGSNIYYAGGSVGIGTTTPWGLLSVNPSGISGPSFVIGSSTATKFIVDNGGNVGVGTTSPNWKLSVAGQASFDDFVRASYFTATSTFRSTLPYASTTALSVSGLTSGRVPYLTTGGLLTDSSNLAFDGTTLTANAISMTTALPVASGGTGTSTARNAGKNVGTYIFVPTGGSGSAESDYLTVTPAYEGQIGLSYYGNKNPFLYFAGSTATGDWKNGFNFPTGISQIGSPNGMDPDLTDLTVYINGSPSAKSNRGDHLFVVENMSTSTYSSGSQSCTSVMGMNYSTLEPEVVGTNYACMAQVPANKFAQIAPGNWMLIGNKDTQSNRGLLIGATSMGAVSGDTGNHSLSYFDFVNKAYRIPVWQAGIYQPLDTVYQFNVTGVSTYPEYQDIYRVNGIQYTVFSAGAGVITATGTTTPPVSGTLSFVAVDAGAPGDASITFTSFSTLRSWKDSFKVEPTTGDILVGGGDASRIRWSSTDFVIASTTLSNWHIGNSGNTTLASETGNSNTSFGDLSGRAITSGNRNTYFGAAAGKQTTSSSDNSIFGASCLSAAYTSAAGSINCFGAASLAALTSGASLNVFGVAAMDLTTSATDDVSIGNYTGRALSGSRTTNVGNESGNAETSADDVTNIGYRAGLLNTTGDRNTNIGSLAGSNITTGSQNIMIGYNVTATSSTSGGGLNIGNLIYGINAGTGNTPASGGAVGIGTTSPWAQLSVNSNAISGPSFVIGSSTATNFVVTNGGNVGIKTVAPAYALDVGGVGRFISAGTDQLILGHSASAYTRLYSDVDGGLVIHSTGPDVGIDDNNMFISNTGVDTYLQINSATGFASKLVLNAAGSGAEIRGTEDNALRMNTNGGEHLTILGDGKVGIGSSTPWATLAVNPVAGAASNQFVVGSSTATNFIITNAGRVGIGTTSPTSLLTVGGDVQFGTSTLAQFKTDYANNIYGMVFPGLTSSPRQGITWNANDGTSYASIYNIGNHSGSPNNEELVVQTVGDIAINPFATNGRVQICVGGVVGCHVTMQYADESTVGSPFKNSIYEESVYKTGASSDYNFAAMRTEGLDAVGNGRMAFYNPAAAQNANRSFDGAEKFVFGVYQGFTSATSSTVGAGYVGTTPPQNGLIVQGNTGIGTTSPYSKLSVVGQVVAANFVGTTTANSSLGGSLLVPLGSNTAPSYSFNGDTNTGIYSESADVIDFTTGGTSQWQISSSGTLYANNAGRFVNTNTGGIIVGGADATFPSLNFGSDNNTGIYRGATHTIDFSTNGVQRATFDASGNLGIGSSTPWATLAVNPVAGAASNQFVVGSSTATNFIITNAGRVGIGTTSPAQLFSVQGNGLFSGNLSVANLTATGTGVFGGALTSGGNISLPVNSKILSGSDNLLFASTSMVSYFLGKNTGNQTFTGSDLIAIGDSVMSTVTSGTQNYGIGQNTLASLTSGIQNFALGGYSLNQVRNGNRNIGIGVGTLQQWNASGDGGNVAIGPAALNVITTGTTNVSIGYFSMDTAAGATHDNVGIGGYTLRGLTTASNQNTAIGTAAGTAVTSGSNNTIIGYNAGSNISSGFNNIIFGQGVTATSSTAANSLNIGNLIYGTGATTGNSPVSTGLVGIGTTTPWGLLSVNPSGISGPSFVVGSSTATKFIVDNGGNVGIGTTTPGSVFGIQSGATGIANFTTSTSTIYNNLDVRGTLHGQTLYAGDLFFANGFSFTEAPLDGSPQGLYLKNQRGTGILSVDERGNLTVAGDICREGAQCFGTSLSTLAADLQTLTSTAATSSRSLSDLSATVAANSESIASLDARLSLLASTTAALASDATSSASAIAAASTTAAVLSVSNSFIQAIANAVRDFIQSAGEWAVAKLTATVVYSERIQTQVAAVMKGLEMTDQSTGQVYCVTIKNAEWDKQPGACGASASSTPPVSPASIPPAPVIVSQQTSSSTSATIPPTLISTTTSATTSTSTPATSLETAGVATSSPSGALQSSADTASSTPREQQITAPDATTAAGTPDPSIATVPPAAADSSQAGDPGSQQSSE